jgi:hypothetical protein
VTRKVTWVPVKRSVARSHIKEGVHTAFRKGSDSAGSALIWQAINNHPAAYDEAMNWLIDSLEFMGLRICVKTKEEE